MSEEALPEALPEAPPEAPPELPPVDQTMYFWVIANADGEIVRTARCNIENAQCQANEYEQIAQADEAWGPSTHYFSNGTVIAYTPEQAAVKNTPQIGDLHWQNSSMSWVDTRDLQIAKEEQWQAVKKQRDAAEYGGFEWDGSRFDSDETSQLKIIGAAAASIVADLNWLKVCVRMLATNAGVTLPPEPEVAIEWTLADNSTRTLNSEDAVAVGLALLTHDGTTHAIGRDLRTLIEGAATNAEVKDVVWP